MCVANKNSPSTGSNESRSSCLLSRSDFSTTGAPFRYSRSNAKTHTLTFTSSILTSFFLRVMSCWNGSTFFSTISHATVSQSSTKLLVSGLIHALSRARMSGYFFERSSELREKMAATPSDSVLVAPLRPSPSPLGASLAT